MCLDATPRIVDHETMLRLASKALEERASRHRSTTPSSSTRHRTSPRSASGSCIQLLEGGTGGRLLLVGDGGQRIYAGGYRLTDLGLDVRGRSSVLELCYRSTDQIMAAVGALGRWLSLEEYGEDGLGQVEVSTIRSGERPQIHAFRDRGRGGWRGCVDSSIPTTRTSTRPPSWRPQTPRPMPWREGDP